MFRRTTKGFQKGFNNNLWFRDQNELVSLPCKSIFENQPNVILISVAVTNSCKISDCSKFALDGLPSSVEKTISPPDKGEIFDILESHNGSLSY